MRFPGFIGGSTTTQSLTFDSHRTVNLYVERAQGEGAANSAALFPTPGFRVWSTVSDVTARALLFADGRMFGVWGRGFYEWDINGVATKWGTVVQDANLAQIVFNGIVGGQLGIASGGNAYSFDLTTNTFAGPYIVGNCTMLAYAAGFGLAFSITTGIVQLSGLNDFTTWTGSNFFQRSLFADPYQTMFVDANNLVWMVGTDSFEVRYNSGVGDQPFSPLSGLVGRYGIAAPFAFGLSALGNFWLARNPEGTGQLVVTEGSSPTPVSNYAFATKVASYLRTSRIDNAEIMVYQQEGHTFTNVSFPGPAATWTLDVEGKDWAERGKWNPARGDYDLWAPRVHCLAFGKHLVGDRTTGMICEMDTNLATETDGVTGIRRLRRAALPFNEHQRTPVDQLELLMDTGLGLVSGQGSAPVIMARFSNDACRTWGNERQAGVGRIGKFMTKPKWTRLGSPEAGGVEVTYSDPTPLRIIDALLNNAEAA